MTKLFLIFFLLLLELESAAEIKNINFRITCYWGSHVNCKTGAALKNGVSAASDHKIIPYGRLVEIKFGTITRNFTIHDTGSAVKARTASRGKYPVLDLYFSNKSKAMKFLSTLPRNQIVKATFRK